MNIGNLRKYQKNFGTMKNFSNRNLKLKLKSCYPVFGQIVVMLICNKVVWIKYTRYFTPDNEPDEIENATHNTFTKQTWISTQAKSRFALQMYCG
jgi:hypothetical protein